jgi:hypothetical protein
MAQRIPISPDILKKELETGREYITAWIEQLDKQGVPAIDTPAGDEAYYVWLTNFVGEMRLLSNKFSGLAEVMSEGVEG